MIQVYRFQMTFSVNHSQRDSLLIETLKNIQTDSDQTDQNDLNKKTIKDSPQRDSMMRNYKILKILKKFPIKKKEDFSGNLLQVAFALQSN